MPTAYEQINCRVGTYSEYLSLDSPDDNSVYFVSDVGKVYVGAKEYTKSASLIDSRPEDGQQGEDGRLYVCENNHSAFVYLDGRWVAVFDSNWPRVASISSGDGVQCSPNPITTSGTVSHSVPAGAEEVEADVSDVTLKLGESFFTSEVSTDKFGHVTSVEKRRVTMPTADQLSTVFKFKGTVQSQDNLPTDGNSTGDVYYVESDSAEYVYLESGWEKLGPIVDTSGLVDKVPDAAGYVACVSESGDIESAGYQPKSGVSEGEYGSYDGNSVQVPCLQVDKYGRVVSAHSEEVKTVSPDFAEDCAVWCAEQCLR